MRCSTFLRFTMAAGLVLLATTGCDLLDPARPSLVEDVEVFGNLMSVGAPEEGGDAAIVKLQVGPPRALEKSAAEDDLEVPERSDGLIADVTVDADTVVLIQGLPGNLDDLSPGTELVAIPLAGTSRMRGVTELSLVAEALMDFDTYRAWRLPKLQRGEDPPRSDAGKINSDGVEMSPIPVGDGRVLYFSARMRASAVAEGEWLGAPRDGLVPEEGASGPVVRSYRAAWRDGGWSPPEPVTFPNLSEALVQEVSWVSEDELECLVTIQTEDGPPWVGRSTRSSQARSWGPVERVEELGDSDAADGYRVPAQDGRIAFASRRHGGPAEDLFVVTPDGSFGRLDLEINTAAPETSPRVGPDNQLYFTRGDRAMRVVGSVAEEVRPAWPHRGLVLEASPTADGRFVFLTVVRLAPGHPDYDLMVAPLAEDGTVGLPQLVDDWSPVTG